MLTYKTKSTLKKLGIALAILAAVAVGLYQAVPAARQWMQTMWAKCSLLFKKK